MRNPEKFFKDWDNYCWFQNPKNGFGLMTKEEYDQMEAEADYDRSCIEAENAWLRKAESANYDDMAFEKWEWERMYT